jgi:hypothetical protein
MGSVLLVNWAFMLSLMSLTLTKETVSEPEIFMSGARIVYVAMGITI